MRRVLQAIGQSRLARDDRGTALIEFAFVLPFLVMLFIGGFQLMDAISAYRKVGSTARTLADLTSQNATMSAAQADEILGASRQVMAPYSPSAAVLRISQISVDANSNATVSWSRALNGTALSTGSTFTMPATLRQANKHFIYSEIQYTYTPNIASSIIGVIPFSQSMFMSPRGTDAIPYS